MRIHVFMNTYNRLLLLETQHIQPPNPSQSFHIEANATHSLRTLATNVELDS